MDIQKEREVFEAWVGSNGRSIERFSDGSYKSMTLDKEWEAWQTAKAQAVPEVISIGNELQSWVAVNSFGAEDVVGDLVIIDANELAEVIEKLTGANA